MTTETQIPLDPVDVWGDAGTIVSKPKDACPKTMESYKDWDEGAYNCMAGGPFICLATGRCLLE